MSHFFQISKKNELISKLELEFKIVEESAAENIVKIKQRAELLKSNDINDSMKKKYPLIL